MLTNQGKSQIVSTLAKMTNQGNISLDKKVDLDDNKDYKETPDFWWKSWNRDPSFGTICCQIDGSVYQGILAMSGENVLFFKKKSFN